MGETATHEELPPDAVVIRGGLVMTVAGLVASFQSHHDRCEARGLEPVYWLSVNCVPGFTAAQVARRAKRPNPMMRVSSVRAIRAAGFTIVETPGRREIDGHCDVFLAVDDTMIPTEDKIGELIGAFGPPVLNPGKRR